MYELIDTHAHLEEVESLDRVLKEAERAGVTSIITMGSTHKSNEWALKISEKQSWGKVKVYAALGLHPWGLEDLNIDSTLGFIRKNVERAVGVGEIGLDYWLREVRRDLEKKKIQKLVFRSLLEIAKDHDKPASIHSRGAWEDCLEMVREVGLKKVVFHWFSGPTEVLEGVLMEKFFISATPAVAFSREHRRAVQVAPLESLLLETDSPVKYRGEVSQPAHIIKSLKAVAGLKGIDEETVANETTKNARTIFKI